MKIILLLILFCITLKTITAQRMLVCYYTNWAQYRPGNSKFTPENLDPHLCTHIIYAFAKLDKGQLAAFECNDENTEWSKGNYQKVLDLKKINPSLKVLLAVGGWNLGSGVFSDMVTNPKSRANFVKTSVDFIKRVGFDGLDLDWEYPANRDGSRPTDKSLFSTLCKELKEAFATNKLLLSAAVGAGKSTMETAYEIENIGKYLDFLNLMSYDLHGSWETFLGHNAPLYARKNEKGDQTTLNVDYAVNHFIKNRFPSSKINLGMASFGRSFQLSNASQNSLGSQAKGAGDAGKVIKSYTREAGMLAYYEVCLLLKQGWTRVWNDEQKVPYAYSGNGWVGYDDFQSLDNKVSYLKQKALGGGMFWTLDSDDFSGQFCGQGKYPLINFVKNKLATKNTAKRLIESSSAEIYDELRSPINSPDDFTTPSDSFSKFVCPSSGMFPNLDNKCLSFFMCKHAGTPDEEVYEHACPPGLMFDSNQKTCNWASLVKCA